MNNAKKQWGSRFEAGPAAIMEKINTSIDFDRRLGLEDITASQAHAQMLGQQGIITTDEAETIVAGLDEVLNEWRTGRLNYIPALEDIHTHVEARLREKIGQVAGKLHTARSRNDQVATDFRLWLRGAIDRISEDIRGLCTALVAVAEQHTETPMAGLTHMQVAQPVNFGHHLMAYAQMFRRDVERLQDCRKRVNESPLGSAALAGTAFPIDRFATARALGFARPLANSMDGVAARDFALEFLAAAAIHGVHLSRLAEEMVLWSSAIIGYIRFSDAFSTGSSIMPQKRNPDAAELVRAKSGRIIGYLMGFLSVLKSLPMTYAKDLQEDKEPIFATVDTLELCLAAMTGMVRDMQPNPEAMLKHLQGGFPTATDLADWLVRETNVAFREAHQITGKIVRMAEHKGCDISELKLAEMQKVAPMFDERVFAVLSVESSMTSRVSYGGTAPEAVRRQIADFRAEFLQTGEPS
ncbi:MAG: argininosuccinate lyase [Alphaproteobacteria bacterium]|nr:argininosuccinate lyase [Alphaproteobacteria bacterium]